MNKRPEKITEENVLTIDVADIAQDRRFSNLKFENAKKKLPKIQKWISEVYELGEQDLLIPNDLNIITDLTKQLINYLNNLLTFEIRTTNDTALGEHNNIESQIDGFYNTVYQNLPMRILPFLRNETARKSVDKKELEKQQKAAAQAEQKYQKLAQALEKKLKFLEAREQAVQAKRGEVAALTFGKHFEKQAEEFQKSADFWRKWGIGIFVAFLLIVLGNFITYLFFPTARGIFTLQYGIVKLALLLLISYGVGFCSKQYNINSNLAVVNKHRKNVAETLNDFYSSGELKEAQSEIVRGGIDAMFKHFTTGHIKALDKDDSPVSQIINQIPKIVSKE